MSGRTRDHLHAPRNLGERAADLVVGGMGSWGFVLVQTVVVGAWITLNLLAYTWRWDPYPFILLNLVFSTQAAYASPLILMASNRAARRDARRDDQEAEEVHLLFEINHRQLEILEALHGGGAGAEAGKGAAQ